MIRPISLFLLFLLLAGGGSAVALADEMLPDAILHPQRKDGHILVVDKAEQLLYLYRHDADGQVALERVMRCSTGGNLGDKLVEGDRKTPNGFYILNDKLLPRELPPIYGALAYTSDYPNAWDKKLGRGGHGIWIHGIDKPLKDYDSNGCVELENADIVQLEDLVRLHDTPLITYEALTLAPISALRAEAERVVEFLETWRQAWTGKDHQAYRDCYDPDFINSEGRSLEAWLDHKRGVARNYQRIRVELKDLRIYRHRDVITVLFTQDYRGDGRFTSMGLKRLYLREDGPGYKIVGEMFMNSPPTETRKWLTVEERRRALETPPLTLAGAPGSSPSAGTDDWPTAEEDDDSGFIVPILNLEEPAAAVSSAARPVWPEESPAEAEARREDEARARAEAEVLARLAEEERLETDRQARLEAEAEAERRAEEALKEELIELARQWAEAWSRQDAEAYFDFYHPDFHYQAKRLNLDDFIDYRRPLIEEAAGIEVKLSAFDVRLNGQTATVAFRQDYRSGQVRDRGRKTLTLRQTGSGWKILAETWRAG